MRALIVSADGFEDRELQFPASELRSAGISVDIATPKGMTIHGKHGAVVHADRDIDAVDPSLYDVVIFPGGRAPAALRTHRKVLAIARDLASRNKVVAAVCHGPEILVAADLLRGKKATAYAAVAPELRKAGAHYVDEAVVVDENLITARKPADLPAFVRALEEKLGLKAI